MSCFHRLPRITKNGVTHRLAHLKCGRWYAKTRKHIQPNCEHRIDNISITADGDDYAVQLSVKLIAKSTDGKDLQLNVQEKWTLALVDNNVKMRNYHVELV